MSEGLLAIPPILPAGISPFQALHGAFHDSLVIPVRTEPVADLAVRRLLSELTPTELMSEIVSMDGGLDVMR